MCACVCVYVCVRANGVCVCTVTFVTEKVSECVLVSACVCVCVQAYICDGVSLCVYVRKCANGNDPKSNMKQQSAPKIFSISAKGHTFNRICICRSL